MPAILSNATGFLLNSDYPLDKVVYLLSGSASFDGSTSFTVAHGLPFRPLVDLTWSYNADFSVSYTNNAGPAPTSAPGYIFDLQVSVYSDDTYLHFNALGPAATRTGYYRVFAFQPDDSNAALPATVSAGDKFELRSDYNYAKLYMAGHIAYPSGDVLLKVPHNLGYIPQTQVWLNTSQMQPLSVTGDDPSGSWQAIIDGSNLTLAIAAMNNPNAGTAYYRIYLDQ